MNKPQDIRLIISSSLSHFYKGNESLRMGNIPEASIIMSQFGLELDEEIESVIKDEGVQKEEGLMRTTDQIVQELIQNKEVMKEAAF